MSDSVVADALASATPAPTPAPAPSPSPAPNPAPAPSPTPAAGAAPAPGNEPVPQEIPQWMTGLPESMQSDATLRRFTSVEELAKGHIHAHMAAKAKSPVAADVMPDSFEAFAASRPAEASAYQFDVPEGVDADYADGFRAKAHEVGLHPMQAKELVAWQNAEAQRQADAAKAIADQAATSWKESEAAAGRNPDQTLGQIVTMLDTLGIKGADDQTLTVADIDSKFGTDKTLALLGSMARMIADPAYIGGDVKPLNLAVLDAKAAKAMYDQKLLNPEWAREAEKAGTVANREYSELTRAMGGSGR